MHSINSYKNLINKYPEIKKSMKSDFIAYYDKKSTKNVNKYSWDLQIPTNDTMKKNTWIENDVFL
ncbi:putative lipoprotein [Staphylococcus aureus]|uniref:Putative lipoprotein n=1 Tax=Staphylococcus aureus TaxID=1280 RepID=A0A380DPS9_STAAU|nr:putative lipoprotein [Staphylococcus aureus]